jgi:CDP-4-dehydro-6-deoxyglucose reductase
VSRFVPVLSRADDSWQGVRGYVQQALLDDAPDFTQLQVYACGSSAMVRSAQQRLLAAGLPANQFHADAFVCTAAA